MIDLITAFLAGLLVGVEVQYRRMKKEGWKRPERSDKQIG